MVSSEFKIVHVVFCLVFTFDANFTSSWQSSPIVLHVDSVALQSGDSSRCGASPPPVDKVKQLAAVLASRGFLNTSTPIWSFFEDFYFSSSRLVGRNSAG